MKNHLACRYYALMAERKMGEMLAATARAKPISGKGQKKTDRRSSATTDGAPTLAELGVSKRESAEAQKLAAMPEAKVQEIVGNPMHLAPACVVLPSVT